MAKNKKEVEKEILKAPNEKITLDEMTYEEEQDEIEDNEKETDTNDDLAIVNDILQFHETNLPTFQIIWEKAKKLINQIFFDHWDNDEKIKHEEQGRQAFNIPLLFSKAMSLWGFEKQARKFLPYDPEGEEDELLTEFFNIIKKRIEKVSKFYYNASLLFFDMCFSCYGVEKLEEYENDLGQKEIKKVVIPYNQFLWDKSSAIKRDLSDCWRFQEFDWVTVNDLKIAYGDDFTEWDKIQENFNRSECVPLEDINNYFDPNEIVIGKDNKVKTVRNPKVKRIIDNKLEILDAYYVSDIKNNNVECFYNKEDAEADLEEKINEARNKFTEAKKLSETNPLIKKAALENGIDLDKEFEEDAYFILKMKKVKRLRRTIIAGNVLLEKPDILEQDYVDYTVYFSLFFHGTTTTPGAVGQDLQTITDRFFSSWDKSLGNDSKGGKQIATNKLDEEYNSPEEASDALNKGENIFVKGESAVYKIEKEGGNSQLMSTVKNVREFTEDMYGGATFQGLSEGANQSGKAVMALQQGGVNMNLNYIDAFDYHRTITDEKLIDKIKKYYRGKLSFEVAGKELTDKMLKVLTDKKMYKESLVKEGSGWLNVPPQTKINGKYLWEASLSVGVAMTGNSMNERDAKYQKIQKWSMDTGIPVPARLAGKYMGLDATEISELEQAEQEFKAQTERRFQLQLEQAKNKAGVDTMKAISPMLQQSESGPAPMGN